MVLSKRERYIAIGSATAVGLLILNYVVIDPYIAQRSAISAGLVEVTERRTEADKAFELQHRLRKVWAEMQAGGLKADASQAESQALNAVIDLAQYSGVTLAVLKPERTVTEGKFQVIGFSVTASGSMRQVSQLVWSLETATIPVRVTDLQITPRRDATDDLSVRLSVSTLCLLPASDKPPAKTASAFGFEAEGARS